MADGFTAQVVLDFNTDELSLDILEGNDAAGFSIIGDPGAGSDEAGDLWAALTAGQGTYDDSLPDIIEHPEEEELPAVA